MYHAVHTSADFSGESVNPFNFAKPFTSQALPLPQSFTIWSIVVLA
jgi:hypothetical protein